MTNCTPYVVAVAPTPTADAKRETSTDGGPIERSRASFPSRRRVMRISSNNDKSNDSNRQASVVQEQTMLMRILTNKSLSFLLLTTIAMIIHVIVLEKEKNRPCDSLGVGVLALSVIPATTRTKSNNLYRGTTRNARGAHSLLTVLQSGPSSSSSPIDGKRSDNNNNNNVDLLPTVEEIGELISQLDSTAENHNVESTEAETSVSTEKTETGLIKHITKTGRKYTSPKTARDQSSDQPYGTTKRNGTKATTTVTPKSMSHDRQQKQKQNQRQWNSKKQQQPKKKKTLSNHQTTPWMAGYHTSRKTQEKIQQTFEAVTKKESVRRILRPTQRSKRVLDTLLQTQTYLCNPANIVGALTYSVKAMGHAYIQKPDPALRRTLYDVFDILHELLVEKQDDKPRIAFQPRQLCNVIWAIAKHVDRDPGLLPSSSSSSRSSTSIPSSLNTDVKTDEGKSDDNGISNKRDTQEGRLDELIDEIAGQLTELLRDEQHEPTEKDTHDEQQKKENSNNNYLKKSAPSRPLMPSTPSKTNLKTGEICMACWAYGKLRPRVIPPGRVVRPQMGRVRQKDISTRRSSPTDRQNIITLKHESWGSRRPFLGPSTLINDKSDDLDTERDYSGTDGDIIDDFFDAVGAALCERRNPNEQTNGVVTKSHHTTSRLEECRWSELANIGWAFASHGISRSADSERLLNHLSFVTANRLAKDGTVATKSNPNLLVRDVAQIIWSLGTLQSDNFRIADGLLDVVDSLIENLQIGKEIGTSFRKGRPLQHWCCADLVQVTIALAHARIDETLLLQSLYEEGIHRLMEGTSESSVTSIGNIADGRRTFHPWEVSIMLWAQARLSLTDPQGTMFEEFATDAPGYFLQALKDHKGSFRDARIGPQEQANIAWSLVVLEKFDSPDAIELLNSIFINSARTCKEEGVIQLDHANQLWQAYFILAEDCPMAVADIPDWFVEYLSDKWTQEKARDKLSSARHKQLSSLLQLMGIDHVNESDEDIDVAIILKPNANWVYQTDTDDWDDERPSPSAESTDKMMLAVEFDGPNHFTRVEHLNRRGDPGSFEPPRALGHTVLKYRLLKKQGWTVVRVPYYEFDRIPFWASMERQRYLQRKLKTSASIEFSEVDVSEYKA
eukprot:CAMPEP_0113514116 /NCGR_PEP_ID=MMETSP0014_2-20120614/40231_1 /TAXON_ID=2857 /ORGANISM="Nitzschia sp." /LENGTH=1125 /DNA_ID=CAMNT_0000410579 /DNA_START=159 /DNA_END=3532 /DNA_ORIENTATION=+ /assembly_acc=CAM_ASM_000159